jgi:uncharacterized protein (TIGR01777 family)
MRVVVAGGSGFLGHALVARLTRDGHEAIVLTRGTDGHDPGGGARAVPWTPDGSAGPWAREVDGAAAVVNLAGAGLADRRWSAARKQLLHDSRIQSRRSLAAAIHGARARPPVFVQASAVGIYGGHANGPTFDESAAPGSDFLAKLCVAWEAETQPIARDGCRVVVLRNGVVLARSGGVLVRMLPAFQLFAGGPVANGRQYMSWIHLDDWVGIAMWAIGNKKVDGAINATSPNPVTSREFAQAIGRAMHRPSWMPVPAFVLRILFGEMARDVLILGQRVVPRRALELVYRFQFEHVDQAMAAVFGRR